MQPVTEGNPERSRLGLGSSPSTGRPLSHRRLRLAAPPASGQARPPPGARHFVFFLSRWALAAFHGNALPETFGGLPWVPPGFARCTRLSSRSSFSLRAPL